MPCSPKTFPRRRTRRGPPGILTLRCRPGPGRAASTSSADSSGETFRGAVLYGNPACSKAHGDLRGNIVAVGSGPRVGRAVGRGPRVGRAVGRGTSSWGLQLPVALCANGSRSGRALRVPGPDSLRNVAAQLHSARLVVRRGANRRRIGCWALALTPNRRATQLPVAFRRLVVRRGDPADVSVAVPSSGRRQPIPNRPGADPAEGGPAARS